MGHLFSRDYFWGWSFNEDISAWDTSSVTTFTYMFFKLESFNQPIIPVFAEAEEAPTEQPPPPPPARRWFSSAEPETEPAAPKAEDTYNRMADWYNEPEAAALRAKWGQSPAPDEFQTWPGFVAVTNAFLDASTSEPEA